MYDFPYINKDGNYAVHSQYCINAMDGEAETMNLPDCLFMPTPVGMMTHLAKIYNLDLKKLAQQQKDLKLH